MSSTALVPISTERRDAYRTAVRVEAIKVVCIHWGTEKQPIGIERAAKLTIERIVRHNSRDADPAFRWHFAAIPDELTVRRRLNEAASEAFYAEKGEPPPLVCIGRRLFMGRYESQYMPRGCEVPSA